ncbi:MAG TPA: FxLYD domain-containing protein [Anaerolineae bacterium]|nr:FxLYD domain-containing protein [Anaerolineae bacterium]
MQNFEDFHRSASQGQPMRRPPARVVRYISPRPAERFSARWRPRPLLSLADLLTLAAVFLAMLACTCTSFVAGRIQRLQIVSPAGESVSRSIFIQNQLPTLTPTLVPTLIAAPPSLPTPVASLETTPLALTATGIFTPVTGPVDSAVVAQAEPALAPFTATLSIAEAGDAVPVPPTQPVTPPTPGLSPVMTPPPGQTPLSTATPVASPTLPPTWTPTSTPSPTASPTVAPTTTPTPTPPPADWAFVGVQLRPHEEAGLLLSGHLVNNTTSTQEIEEVKGTFYDAQGQVIAADDLVYGYWPVDLVLPGGGVPFELIIEGISETAGYDLGVQANPSDEKLLQDFEFKDLNQRNENGNYCLGGTLETSGDEPEDYLIISAALYDDQGRVVGFSDNQDIFPEDIADGQSVGFEICLPTPVEPIARYDVLAWGQ